MIAITAKMNPDLDAYASAFALAEFFNKTGKQAKGFCLGNVQREVEFLNKEFGIEKLSCEVEEFKKADSYIIVDSSNLKGMPEGLKPEEVLEVIDHRDYEKAENYFPKAKIQIEKVGACATLIAERFENVSISKESALLLFGAIGSNTLNFASPLTTERDRKAFNWLKEKAEAPFDLIERMFEYKSRFSDESFEKVFRDDFKSIEKNGKTVGIAQIEALRAKEIIKQRKEQILSLLETIQKEKSLDYIFCNLVGLKEKKSFLITNHSLTKELLNKAIFPNTARKFVDGIVEMPSFALRKEIIPLILRILRH